MSENEQHPAEPGDMQTVAIAPDTAEQPTVANVSADVLSTMKVEPPVESAETADPEATQALSADPATTQALTEDVTATQALAEDPTSTQPMAEDPTATRALIEDPTATRALADEEPPGTLLLTEPGDPSQNPVPTNPMATNPMATNPVATNPSQDSAAQGYRRVGPGVPAAQKQSSTSGIDPATAAAWHGVPPRKPRRALLRGWLLPLLVLAVVIALLLWRQSGGRLSVSGVTAAAGTPSIGCDSTQTVTATLRTNGAAGTIVYRWVRSDGTVSDALRQTVGNGTKQVDVVLRWAFSGHGSMHALATIDVESPGTASAVASFAYNCP